MPTSNAEELRLFLKCTVIGRGGFGPCACCCDWSRRFWTLRLLCGFNVTSLEELPFIIAQVPIFLSAEWRDSTQRK